MLSTNGDVYFYDEYGRILSLEEAKEQVRRNPKRGCGIYRRTQIGKETFDEWAFGVRLPGSTPRGPELVRQIVRGYMTLKAGLDLYCVRCDQIKLLRDLKPKIHEAFSDPELRLERPRLCDLLDEVEAASAKLATPV
jgi:hypothetical protein